MTRAKTTEFEDAVLGTVQIRRHHNARGIRFRVSPKGQLLATTAPRTPLYLIKQATARSRRDIKRLIDEYSQSVRYTDGQLIGKSHRLRVVPANIDQPHAATHDRIITVQIPERSDADSTEIQRLIQSAVISALKKEAKTYLSRRLRHLAARYGYQYSNVRYPHTGTRWGSCTSAGVISLNIALMKLPLELIDYVLIHELCHTREMNHSAAFWRLVEAADPDYKQHRRAIKAESPAL